MNGEIDPASEAIGELRAQNRAILETLRAIDSKLAVVPRLMERVEAMWPHVEDYRKLKQRGIGLLMAASIGGGGLWELVRSTWAHFSP